MLNFNFNFRLYLEEKFGNIQPYYNLRFLINNLKICGCWPPMNVHRYVYVIWSIFILSNSVGHMILAQTAFVLRTGGESEKIASAMSLLISNYISAFKTYVMLRHQKRIQDLLVYADAKRFTCDDPETMKKLQYKFSTASFVHYAIFQSAGFLACAGWTLSSALHTLGDQNDRVLPVNAWYPFDFLASPLYEVTLVVQSMAVVICCLHNVSMDGLIIGLMAVVSCEFEILKTRLREIGDNVRKLGASEYLKTKEIDERLCKELMLCVEHHMVIIGYAKELEEIFHFAIFLQFLDNCCVICVSAFALSKLTEYEMSTILGNLMYLGAIIYQLFLYCYFGNDVSIQVFTILRRQNRISHILDVIKSDVFSRYNFRHERIQSSYVLKGVFHHVAYQSLALAAVFCWGFTPVADLIAGNERRLPMEGWYPYNVTETPAFQLTCFHQIAATVFGCIQNIAMDTLVTGLLTVACCQMEILKSNLSQIGGCSKHSKSAESTAISTADVEDELRHCIEHHNAIIDFTKEVEAIFHLTIIVQFLVNCIIICLTAFRMTEMKVFAPAELIGMTMYLWCMIYQIFIYCWHGNEIVLQSESVAVAAFAGNWWRCSERYKRGLRLLMARANRPVTLKAGYLLTLSLQTFVAILRASYSFFTVLKSATD